MLNYKGYYAKVEYDPDTRLLGGAVIGTRDLIFFEVEDPGQVEAAFRDVVDEYLALCEERGARPDRPYSGKFQVRLDPDLHRRAAAAAEAKGESLNSLVIEAIEDAVRGGVREGVDLDRPRSLEVADDEPAWSGKH